MVIWSSEIKDLEKLYDSIKGKFPKLDNELQRLLKTDDENIVLVYSRRCLEIIITDLSERELKRPRGTEPLKGVIDRLNKEEKIPYNITVSMQNLNSLSTFGAHPKDFDPRQVKPVILDLTTVIDWYLKYSETLDIGEAKQGTVKEGKKAPVSYRKEPLKLRKRIILISGILLVCALVVVGLVVFDIIGGGNQAKARSIESLAILPFNNYTGIDGLDYFVSGMHSALIGDVGKISGLRVISETSSKAYKNIDKSVSDIASELKVDGVIEASVLCLEDSICLQLKLINASGKEEVLWTGDYKEDKSQILKLYNKITKQIADEMRIKLTPEENQLLARSRTVDRNAYDEYLKACSYLGDASRESLNKALRYLNNAIEKDPGWAPLYAGLAQVWWAIEQMGWELPSVASPKIYENLNKALQLDPDFADSHYLNANTALWIEWNWEKSEKEFLRALAINPNDVYSRMFYGYLLCILQRTDEALIQGKLALDLDPLNPLMMCWYGQILIGSGDCRGGVTYAEKVLAVDPKHLVANNVLSLAAYQCKDYEKAFQADINHSFPVIIGENALKGIEKIYHDQGFSAAYEELAHRIEKFASDKPELSLNVAATYNCANKPDKAMDWLEKAFENHDPNMPMIATRMFNFDPLFDNPKFIEIVKKMNLPLPKD